MYLRGQCSNAGASFVNISSYLEAMVLFMNFKRLEHSRPLMLLVRHMWLPTCRVQDLSPTRMFRKCQSKGNNDYRETPPPPELILVWWQYGDRHCPNILFSFPFHLQQTLFQIHLLWQEEAAELKEGVFVKDHIESRSHVGTADSRRLDPSISQRCAAWREGKQSLKHPVWTQGWSWASNHFYSLTTGDRRTKKSVLWMDLNF